VGDVEWAVDAVAPGSGDCPERRDGERFGIHDYERGAPLGGAGQPRAQLEGDVEDAAILAHFADGDAFGGAGDVYGNRREEEGADGDD